MHIPPIIALIAWIPAGLFFFRRFPIRVAVLMNCIGGWAVLPSANFVYSPSPFPYWILGVGIASQYFITKATIIGLTAFLGVLLNDRKSLFAFQLTFWDMPFVMWCIVPLLSGIANPEVFGESLRGEFYQLLAWGVPYILGRLYFSDTESLRLAARAFVIAGLLYIPVCFVEIFTGPQLYAHIYGYQPFQWTGAHRYVGFRPVGFLENGNQLGIWMATSALIAAWLWARRSVSHVLGLPIQLVAVALFITTILCQSTASIVLLICLLPLVFVSQRDVPRALAVVVVLGIVAFGGLRLAKVISLRTLVKQNRTAHSVAVFLKRIGKPSFGWRMSLDEHNINLALDRPILGNGQWNWWEESNQRPWGLWLLVFGMYGIVGLLALQFLQLMPVVRSVWFPLARADMEYQNLRHALAAAILISAVDNLLNSSMILPLVVVIGGMSAWPSAASNVVVQVQSTLELLPEPANTPRKYGRTRFDTAPPPAGEHRWTASAATGSRTSSQFRRTAAVPGSDVPEPSTIDS